MRVVAGRWKGRRLKAPAGDAVRPTTDRVKEAMFSILGPAVPGSTFVDLCCGAGGLGIEALSRGADLALFVDSAARSLAAARANLEVCGAESSRFRLVRSEALRWLANDSPEQSPDSGLVVVADPPYQTPVAGAIMGVLVKLAAAGNFAAGVVEFGPHTPDLPADLESSPLWTVRRYGECRLAVIRPGAAPVTEGE
jgi:16S rRNA (guanine966-N2)-methyltransferase